MGHQVTFSEDFVLAQPPLVVEQLYLDPRWHERRIVAMGGEVLERDFGETAGEYHANMRYEVEAAIPLPTALKRLAGSLRRVAVTQEMTWSLTTKTGVMVLHPDGLGSVSMTCKLELIDDPAGSNTRMNWTVDCDIPVIGGAVAKFLARDIQAKNGMIRDLSARMLAERSPGV